MPPAFAKLIVMGFIVFVIRFLCVVGEVIFWRHSQRGATESPLAMCASAGLL
jgi:hypothetical protein